MPFPSFPTGSILSDCRIRRTGSRLLRSAVLLCSLALAACTSLPRTPYSAADASGSRVLDIDGPRRYTDDPVTTVRFEKNDLSSSRTYLAPSGGGADGAHGVAVWNAWTAACLRPT